MTAVNSLKAKTPMKKTYEPPNDGPLDGIEQALVRALVPILVAKIREELKQQPAPAAPSAAPPRTAWFDVDGARNYLSHCGGKKPSRKTVYNWVKAGMRVARVGNTGKRLMFCEQWIDEFLGRAKGPSKP